ncbi:MAG: DMT family transporter [Paucibacter sp.]|nr:DMT family transporter [Roseateles sp.]
MTHRRAAWTMVLVTLLWSMAGVVTRHLEAARSFELTFWRSAFNALALVPLLTLEQGRRWRWPDRTVWISSLCWAAMFTAFMVALTLTTVANVLVTMASGPLLAALLARVFLHHRLSLRNWLAIGGGAVGVAVMFAGGMSGQGLAGMAIAVVVPLASAVNWTLMQGRSEADLPLALLLGAVLSALLTLPLAWPLQASPHDMGLLAMLGVFQLAIPCLIVIRVARALPAPEIALLGLLEVVFGVLWAWLGAGEEPGLASAVGGFIVLAALALKDQGLQETT